MNMETVAWPDGALNFFFSNFHDAYQICFIQRFFYPIQENQKTSTSCIKNTSHKKVDHMILKEIFETNFRFTNFHFFQIKKHSGCFIQRFFYPIQEISKKKPVSKTCLIKKLITWCWKRFWNEFSIHSQIFIFFKLKKHSGLKTNHKYSYVLKIIYGQILCVTTYTKHSYPFIKFW